MKTTNDEEPSLWNQFITLFKPMRKIESGFRDIISGEYVNYYVDYQGKAWMATGPRAGFRVRAKLYDTNYKENP
jgi:hypothetical protein